MVTEKIISILLVDDDPHTCEIFKLVMDYNQLPLVVFSEPEAAIRYLQENAPNVVVLDLFLPEMDGYQVLDQIRATALDPHCRVIATTAYYTNDTGQEVKRRGFDGFLAKPFAAESLVPYLQHIVGHDQGS